MVRIEVACDATEERHIRLGERPPPLKRFPQRDLLERLGQPLAKPIRWFLRHPLPPARTHYCSLPVASNRSEFPANSTLAFRFCKRLPYEDVVAVRALPMSRAGVITLARSYRLQRCAKVRDACRTSPQLPTPRMASKVRKRRFRPSRTRISPRTP